MKRAITNAKGILFMPCSRIEKDCHQHKKEPSSYKQVLTDAKAFQKTNMSLKNNTEKPQQCI